MKLWNTTAELAALALPGLPATRQGWDEHAASEGWADQPGKSRPRAGRGGGVEYHISLLSAVDLALYAAKTVGAIDITPEEAQRASSAPAGLSTPALESLDARLAITAAADRFERGAKMSQITAAMLFCALYNAEKITVEPWVRAAVRQLSPRTLARWRAHRAKGEVTRLGVDRGAARRGSSTLETAQEGAVRLYILAAIAHQPHLSADHVRLLVAAKFPMFNAPPVRTFQRFLSRLKTEQKVALTKITNPDAFKSHYRLSGTNSHACERLNELWMIDASPADVLLKTGRHSIYACIDVYSRRLVIYVTKTPRSEAVCLLMRRAIIAWGVPETVKTDNGSDFVARATVRLLDDLKINIETSTAFSPEQKGHIERAIKTFQHDLCPLLPGYIGHSVADRKVIEARKAFSARLGESDANAFCVDLDAAELQKYCDQWAEGRYAHRPHSGIDGRTPYEMAASARGTIRRIADVRALDLLLSPIADGGGLRTVTKTGVRIAGSHYIIGTVLPGTQVLARMDPEDMGRAWLFTPDGGAYLGEAICPELAGIDPAAAVASARKAQQDYLKAATADIKREMGRIQPRDMVEAVLRDQAKADGKLVEFPKRVEHVSTPALEAARDALDDAPAPAQQEPAPPRAPEIMPEPKVHTLPETEHQRFRRALDMEKRLADGLSISTEDALWLGGYQQGAEYKAFRMVPEYFQATKGSV